MTVFDKRIQPEWKPVLVIDTKDENRLFLKDGLPTPAELERALWSSRLGDGPREVRVRHYVPYNNNDQYRPSVAMLNLAVTYSTTEDGEFDTESPLLYFKDVTSRKRIKETLNLLRRGVITKAVFEVKNYDFGVAFYLNTQYQFLSTEEFNLSACDFKIYGDIEVLFDYWCHISSDFDVMEDEIDLETSRSWEIKAFDWKGSLLSRREAIRRVIQVLFERSDEGSLPSLTILDIAEIKALIK